MLADEDVELTLFLRDASKLPDAPEGARVVEGDVLDREQLDPAVRAQDIVYANLAGDLDAQAERIVESMATAGVQRLIFVTALGIYDEGSRQVRRVEPPSDRPDAGPVPSGGRHDRGVRTGLHHPSACLAHQRRRGGARRRHRQVPEPVVALESGREQARDGR
jgi:putative NAD(P)-binding protein